MIFKISSELSQITSNMKITFNLILEQSKDLNGKERRVLSHFTFNNKEYMRFSPNGYISIDISRKSEKGENWNKNNTIIIGKSARYHLVRCLKSVFNRCLQEKNLYKKIDDTLHIDKDLAETLTVTKPIAGKTIRIVPCVWTDDRVSDDDFITAAGFIIMINTPSNYCILRHEEYTYLIDELDRVDFDGLAMNLYNIYVTNKNIKLDDFKATPIIEDTSYKDEPQMIRGQIQESKDVIPDLK